jgi:hypothetical protein
MKEEVVEMQKVESRKAKVGRMGEGRSGGQTVLVLLGDEKPGAVPT